MRVCGAHVLTHVRTRVHACEGAHVRVCVCVCMCVRLRARACGLAGARGCALEGADVRTCVRACEGAYVPVCA